MAVRLTKQSFELQKVFNIHTYIHTNFIQDVNKLIYKKNNIKRRLEKRSAVIGRDGREI